MSRFHGPRERISFSPAPANFLADRKQVTAVAAVTLAKNLNLQNQAGQIRLLADFGPLRFPADISGKVSWR
jgi:hypothetical protein